MNDIAVGPGRDLAEAPPRTCSRVVAQNNRSPPGQQNAITTGEGNRRASGLGLDFIEILGGHGYLLHKFLSPLSNSRDDEYGGSLENRMRFPLAVFEAVRDAFAHERTVTMRVSATDWVEGGWSIDETIAFVKALQARGCAAIEVSSGGSSPSAQIPVGPGY